ncbi:nucleotide-binding protein [Sphingomonas radiodurans]|uniref:nucleotide-binding protein n=1 Tax=Sphingomonas radiodurans TaxID=2890321 RepID=UPI001E480994|nr:nucleotide-binding protein [Sphingomonas radiodurans]WBH15457.1 nucleotide-binding protein [Sphingomonas radiodurans]
MTSATTSTDDVFINCPFDPEYAPSFRAIIVAILICGFRPRSAQELDDAGHTRIDKIERIIEECRYGIHDLSRTELDDKHQLPRFNMPLELGLFLGAKRYGGKHQKLKRMLVLDIEQFRYRMFISDLAGIDIHEHRGDPILALREVRDWLANVSRRELPSADRVERIYKAFLTDLPALADALDFDPENIPYVDFMRIVARWLIEQPS